MHNIIAHHALFPFSKIKTQAATFHDLFDIQNLDWSERFLMSSLDTRFQWALVKYSGTQMIGPILWKLIVLKSQSDYLHALMVLMQELQKMGLKQYGGENVKKCTTDIFDKSNR